MDDEAELANVKVVLLQEFSELFNILSNQPSAIIEQLCHMLPKAALTSMRISASPDTVHREQVKTMLDYFTVASAEECCQFLEIVCMLCENIPMHLEAKLLSATWHGNCEYKTMPLKKRQVSSLCRGCLQCAL